MNLRERFNRIMRFQGVDRLPYVEFRGLESVRRLRWVNEGMPEDASPYEYFGFDEAGNDRATAFLNGGRGEEHIEIDMYALPRFEPRPVEHRGEYFYTLDVRNGILLKRLAARNNKDLSVKAHGISPVQTHEDWLEYKKRFEPASPERYPRIRQYTHHLTIYPLDYPETWEEAVRDMEKAAHIVTMTLASGYNFISNAVGVERLFEMLILEPDWTHEMMDHFGWFMREASRKAVETARIDYIQIDDNTPPRTVHGELIISPDMYMNYVGGTHRENLAMAAEAGIELVKVHLTRNRPFDEMIVRMVVDAGMTPILPADAEGPFTVSERRRQYGGKYPIIGGMDMRVLSRGRKAIDDMIDCVFTDAVEGGYMPLMCDRFGNYLEVSLDNYLYYTQAFRGANGM